MRGQSSWGLTSIIISSQPDLSLTPFSTKQTPGNAYAKQADSHSSSFKGLNLKLASVFGATGVDWKSNKTTHHSK